MHERPHHPPRRRRGCGPSGLIAALAMAALTTACAGAEPPAPAPSPVPSLTQDQQDDAAFRDIMTRYVDLDANTATTDDLEQLLTGTVLDGERQGLLDARQAGEQTEGKEVMSGFQVTDRGRDPQDALYMTAQVCLDTSGTRIVDSNGQDVTPERDARLSLQVKALEPEPGSWRISDIVRNEDVRACG